MSTMEVKNTSLMMSFSQNIKSTLGLMGGVGIILLALVSFVMQMNLADLFVKIKIRLTI